ncbi:Multidrug efflux pump subunit AcrB [Alkalispirochaeta americana]|uniref:Multidrug efflux pump subunit AcrB n=1 Tax=Alkalispirochaeta americana TaxID=159291 RepID=A0A1N6SJP9_9SPIO|nr:efflux RND transporter permease subunit [Alkalispirochaeta americana]SIQ41300.1 Multidrug efflux pump subunit AcrB [Alkalispirochaeta americana]
MSIAGRSVSNPVLVNILTVVILVLGLFSYQRLPREQFAEVPFYFITIGVPYPGVAAEDVERSVTIPLEDEMANLDRLDRIRSRTREGFSSVTLEFDQAVSRREFDRLFQEVQNRFNRVSLPAGVQQETIQEFSSNDFLPVIELVLSGEAPYGELVETAEAFRDRLRSIRGVSRIELVGVRDREITVRLDQDLLEAYQVSLFEVVQALQQRNATVPGGVLTTGDREYLLRTVGAVRSVRELEDTVVRGPEGTGSHSLQLSSLGRVSEEYRREGTMARFNGKPAVSLRVTKLPRASSIGIIDAIHRRVASLEDALPADITLDYFSDQSVPINNSLDTLLSNALLGLVLVVLVLYAFLGLRNALMTALGIPLTLAMTFLVLDSLGETLNSNTLFGLVLVLGLIVDHAIVNVENSYRLQQQGLSRRDAAVAGTNQVILPVLAATATTVAAFLPLAFLPGVVGRFLRVVPITVSIALVASALEASVILPSHYADWPGREKAPRRRLITALQDRFEVLLRRLYRRRGITLTVIFLAMVAVFSQAGRVPLDLFASEEVSLFYIEIEMPPGSSLERTSRTTELFENRLLDSSRTDDIRAVSSSVGFSGGGRSGERRSNLAQISVELRTPQAGRTASLQTVMEDLQEETAHIAGPEVVVFREQPSGPPRDPPVSFRLFGDDLQALRQVAEQFRLHLEQYPELYNITDNFDRGTPEVRITVDHQAAARYGLSIQATGDFLRGVLEGVPAGSVFLGNRETDLRVRYNLPEDITLEEALQVQIAGPRERMIPFSSVASARVDQGISLIRRVDGTREVTVTAEARTTDRLGEINRDLDRLWQEEISPGFPGLSLTLEGRFAEILTIFLDILRVFLVGIFLIYAILGTQFRSYTQPFLILFSVPFAFVGVIVFLLISAVPLSSTVIYAGAALAGIAVNDSIVLLSFINERRSQGDSVADAVAGAARTRFRAILLTSLTTIGGLLPTALGLFGESPLWGPMAGTIVFGLLFSTVTALLVMPCLYGFFYDRRGGSRLA